MATAPAPVRIAMWSGPRNISTALMRAWGNRPDTFVIDEPFYAYYLKATGKKHPGADEVIATGETDWRKVVTQLTSPFPNGKRIFFQKQMTHHLLPDVGREWLASVMNCFLIRDPRDVIVSYVKKREDPTLEDLGFVQQAEIFNLVCARTDAPPPVIEAHDVLKNPKKRWDYCAMRSVSSLANRCFPGHRDYARPTESGQSIGTTRWQDRHRSNRIRRSMLKYRNIYAKSTTAPANVMTGFMSTGCVESRITRISRI